MIVQVGSWQELADHLSGKANWQSFVIDDLDGSWHEQLEVPAHIDVVSAGYLGGDVSESDVLAIGRSGQPLIVARLGDDFEITPVWLRDLEAAGLHCYATIRIEGAESETTVVDAHKASPEYLDSAKGRVLVLVGESIREGFSATLAAFLSQINLSLGEALAHQRAATEEAKGGVRRRRARIETLDAAIATRDQRITQLDTAIVGRDQRIAELEAAVGQRDTRVASLEAAVATRDDQISSMATAAEEAADAIDELAFLRRQYEEETSNRESMRAETVNLRLDLTRARRMLAVVSVIAAVLALATLALALA